MGENTPRQSKKGKQNQKSTIKAWRQAQHQPAAWQHVHSTCAAPKDVSEKLAFLRQNRLGRLSLIPTPDFWRGIHQQAASDPEPMRPILHLDYTASAQSLEFVESYLTDCMRSYANTHTETSATGKLSTQRLHKALAVLKEHVKAPAGAFALAAGYGATGAIERIQKILGLYMSPRGQKLMQEQFQIDVKAMMGQKYVVFVGPSEHHSNDVSWQDDALCQFVRIKAIAQGDHVNAVDLDDLDRQLARFPDHIKIGSFSAASNVTGMASDLKAIGQVLRRHNAFFLVDYAAAGPYDDINMQGDQIDAIFLSAHKNLGGTNLGILIANERLYDMSANPSFGGGGTVSAVTPWEYRFHTAIEEREFPGTPAIRQIWQAALSFQVKDWIGHEDIHRLDQKLCQDMMAFFTDHPRLSILGNPDPKKRHPIFSFLIGHGDRYLHHTFIASLLNDLFGIQARSGCACAGPFGHELLGIEKELSDKYLVVIQHVLNGFKPGWTRIGTHYTLDQPELDYLKQALSGIAWFGALYLDQYWFDPYTGDWQHELMPDTNAAFDLQNALGHQNGPSRALPELADETALYASFANQIADFIILTAYKMTLLLTKTANVRVEQSTLEQLAISLTDDIRQQITDDQASEHDFCTRVADKVCPIIQPLRSESADCKREVVTRINSILFRPQNHQELYQPFSGLLDEVRFFYVWRHRMRPTIDPATESALNAMDSVSLKEAADKGCSPCQESS
jgi:selenocysteine lyase/cysteine desulfurase